MPIVETDANINRITNAATLRSTVCAVLFSLALGSPVGYYALGDSMSYGLGSGDAAEAFPMVLGRATGVSVDNLAITGAMTNDVESEVNSIAPGAEFVTISVGITDVLAIYKRAETPAQFEAAYRRLVDNVRKRAPHARIVLIGLMDRTMLVRTSVGRVPLGSFARIRAITITANADIAGLGYPFCGFAADYYVPRNFVPDGFHPSLMGAQYIARCIRAKWAITSGPELS